MMNNHPVKFLMSFQNMFLAIYEKVVKEFQLKNKNENNFF